MVVFEALLKGPFRDYVWFLGELPKQILGRQSPITKQIPEEIWPFEEALAMYILL